MWVEGHVFRVWFIFHGPHVTITVVQFCLFISNYYHNDLHKKDSFRVREIINNFGKICI